MILKAEGGSWLIDQLIDWWILVYSNYILTSYVIINLVNWIIKTKHYRNNQLIYLYKTLSGELL